MESSIYDSDLNEEKLDKVIADKPELAVLRYFGEISVELDGDLTEEDNRFDAPYQEGSVRGGSVDMVVENFKVSWYPNEDDLDCLNELVKHNELSEDLYNKFKNLVLSEPKKNISYDLTELVSETKLEKLKEEYIEDNRE